MKTSELIKRLIDSVAQYGDLDVCYYGDSDVEMNIEGIYKAVGYEDDLVMLEGSEREL
jgi:hypothetical protein